MTAPIAIIGQGAWGSALAATLAAAGAEILPWTRRTDDACLADASLAILAVPAQATREVLARVRGALPEAIPVVLTAKGLEIGTLLRQSEIVGAILPGHPVSVLSGPSFAADLGRGLPTAVTLATVWEGGEALQRRLATASLRPYLSADVIGAELGGALKNVIAIGCGAAIGAGLGESARAALIARGFAELNRVARAAGAQPETLAGLSGLGDLALTCTSAQSRNFRYGVALGAESTAPASGTYEGAATAGAAQALAARLSVDAPIITAVAALVAGRASVQESLDRLFSRPLRRE